MYVSVGERERERDRETESEREGLISLFNGISIFMDYLMPKSFL